ncbi:ATP-binding cassette domain-containing protein [uncultured Methanolobus sp.]|uniref:ABC transporter ATP-binding protein n=1 Tax=uncultured Methanolobus sp. TaxID=218300 RepID=UPI0029C80D58|nr:ATP-binding cassette domain-containing protein [uncultured Methanolobus sp.]
MSSGVSVGVIIMDDSWLIKIDNVSKVFKGKGMFRNEPEVKALDDVSLSVKKGEVLGIIGQSGSGKTTLGKLILGLLKPSSGNISFADISSKSTGTAKPAVQVIFQDPYDSLSHMMTVEQLVAEPCIIQNRKNVDTNMIYRALESVGLTPVESFLHKYPHTLSGGQRQRVAIARAIITEPDMIIADEPISMLDASIGVDILNLMLDMKEKMGITFMFITHDIAAAAYISDNIAVMKDGKIVEYGSRKQIISDCCHEYTRSLLLSATSGKTENEYFCSEA